MALPIETPSLFGDIKYPVAKEILEAQQDVMWTANEIPVENDIQDYKQHMSPSQYNLASITLDTFVEVEQGVGDVWAEIASWYPHSEIEGAATTIAAMEKGVHAFFYQKMADVMNIAPETTAAHQEEIQSLKSKLTLIKKITSNMSDNKPLALATVALIEQVLLFSNFAMLKSFQSNGNNLITNTITGVDFVVADETIHGIFAAYLHNTVITESGADFNHAEHNYNVTEIVHEIIEHEYSIIDYTYADIERINNISADEVKVFIRSRANEILAQLNILPAYIEEPNPIAEWFYKSAKSIKMHDFFVSGTSQYRRNWKTNNLSRLPHIGATNEQN